MEEVWLDIEEFENYEISDQGRVRPKIKYLATKTNKSGNLEVSLNKNGKSCGKMLGRLVYEAFTGKKLTNNDVIIYLDGDKTNCSFNNLKVITRSERERMAYDTGEKKATKYELYGEYLTIGQIAEKTGINLKTLEKRIYTYGWNAYEAVEIPLNVYKRKEDK